MRAAIEMLEAALELAKSQNAEDHSQAADIAEAAVSAIRNGVEFER